MKQECYPEYPILLVDDEEAILHSFEVTLSRHGINNTIRCMESRAVMEQLRERDLDLVLLDLNMPHLSGEELLHKITEEHPELPVVIITGNDTIDSAVTCIKKGAYDYLVKPISRERLLTTVTHILTAQRLRRENTRLRENMRSEHLKHPECFTEIITSNQLMLSVFKYIEAVAPTPQPVLLTGETGTGKELVARAIHRASRRRGRFVAVNIAGLDDNMFSDTLFGHRRGAFTGADTSRSGMIDTAEGGTLFLDEIGDISPACQMKLLRLLQEREFIPLGADAPVRTDARVIVATNADIQALREGRRFREDLFFRLTTHQVQLPPLRQRLDDLPLLAPHFIEKAALTLDKKAPTPPRELISLLSTYHFPGNIRELESMIFDAISRHQSGVLSMAVFREHTRNHRDSENGPATKMPDNGDAPLIHLPGRFPTLKEADQFIMEEAMKRAQGNQRQAAVLLGISRPALNKRLKKKQEEPAPFSSHRYS
ncbi:MAG: sigma-54-dependent Fis family transcriptional regulator [Spartobacteria bacterium]|nr:sigma-54-dependent Fis family transcriptional regulator [Spartobacteria bacterium]